MQDCEIKNHEIIACLLDKFLIKSKSECTSRRLESDPGLSDVTHILVDEVHERSEDSDFLLMILRDTLRMVSVFFKWSIRTGSLGPRQIKIWIMVS